MLEIAMNTENRWAIADLSPSSIEAAVRQARAERADAIRTAVVELLALFRQVAAGFRPNRRDLPQTGALA
jgi:hypothetical protein